MKRLGIILALGILVVLGGFAAIFALSRQEPDATVPTPSDAPFPIVGPGGAQSGAVSIELATVDGGSLPVQNFIANGTTIADSQNPGTYIVAGDLGYCLEDGRCPSTGVTDYTIAYFEREQAFMIGLGAEPLGEVRARAEAELAATLGIDRAGLCRLRITVGTTVYVNDRYGAMENLGVSGCPGAVPLPS